MSEKGRFTLIETQTKIMPNGILSLDFRQGQNFFIGNPYEDQYLKLRIMHIDEARLRLSITEKVRSTRNIGRVHVDMDKRYRLLDTQLYLKSVLREIGDGVNIYLSAPPNVDIVRPGFIRR